MSWGRHAASSAAAPKSRANQAGCQLRPLRREVFPLPEVALQIVELQGAVLVALDQLPAAGADRTAGASSLVRVVRVVEEESVAIQRAARIAQERKQAAPLDGGIEGGDSGDLGEGRKPVVRNHRFVAHHPWPRYAGKAHDPRHAEPPLVQVALPGAERRRGRRRGVVEVPGEERLRHRQASIVGAEDEQRPIGDAQPLQGVHHSAHALVHALDHRGVHRVLLRLRIGAPALPLGLVLGDLLGLRLERDVNGVVREEQKERTRSGGVAIDEIDRLPRENVRVVLAEVPVEQDGRDPVANPRPEAVGMVLVEALAQRRRIAQVPLPDHARHVARSLQSLGQGLLRGR